MKSMMRLVAASVAATGVAVLGLAAPVHADTGEFLDYLYRNEIGVSADELQQSDLDTGQAICGIFATAPDAGNDPNHEAVDYMMTGEHPASEEDAAVWVVGSVLYLCPQSAELLPGE